MGGGEHDEVAAKLAVIDKALAELPAGSRREIEAEFTVAVLADQRNMSVYAVHQRALRWCSHRELPTGRMAYREAATLAKREAADAAKPAPGHCRTCGVVLVPGQVDYCDDHAPPPGSWRS